MNNVDDQTEDHSDWGDCFLKIRWHSCFGDRIFYEVDLLETPIIRFLHDGMVIEERALSKFEVSAITDMTRKINLQFLFKQEGLLYFEVPNVPCQLSIRTKFCFLDLTWHSSDEEGEPRKFRHLNGLTKMIEKMIEVDLSKLSMPIYY